MSRKEKFITGMREMAKRAKAQGIEVTPEVEAEINLMEQHYDLIMSMGPVVLAALNLECSMNQTGESLERCFEMADGTRNMLARQIDLHRRMSSEMGAPVGRPN